MLGRVESHKDVERLIGFATEDIRKDLMSSLVARENTQMGYTLGVDLGTTFTAAAIARGDQREVLNLGTRFSQACDLGVCGGP